MPPPSDKVKLIFGGIINELYFSLVFGRVD